MLESQIVVLETSSPESRPIDTIKSVAYLIGTTTVLTQPEQFD
jgi:hypothetical protein